MKTAARLLCIVSWLLTGYFVTGCEGMPVKFSVSGDVAVKGMDQPIRVEMGVWKFTVSGKSAKEVQPVQPLP